MAAAGRSQHQPSLRAATGIAHPTPPMPVHANIMHGNDAVVPAARTPIQLRVSDRSRLSEVTMSLWSGYVIIHAYIHTCIQLPHACACGAAF